MRDYLKELMETWTNHGEQAAYSRVRALLHDIRDDVVRLRKQEEAIQALGQVLRDHPDVDSSAEPADAADGLEPIESSERSRFIVEAAYEIYHDILNDNFRGSEPAFIRAQNVLDLLKRRGLDLGVQQPLAVIGTVLSNADGFHRIARNTFQYQQKETPSPSDSGDYGYDAADDLPF